MSSSPESQPEQEESQLVAEDGSNDEIESSAQPTLQQPTSPPEEVSESPKDIGAADEEGDQQEAAGDEVEENDDDAAEDGGADKDVEDEAKKSPKKKDAKRKRDSPGHFKAKDAANDTPQSRFKGVYYVLGGRWESKITYQSKTRHIGTFDTEIQAALAFDSKAHQLGVPHRSNFLYDCDGNVLSTDMVEPFRGVRRTRDKWRAVGAAPDGQSVNLGTFDSRREAMEECNRWAGETSRKQQQQQRPENAFAYPRGAAIAPPPGWNTMVAPAGYESPYYPVARRHGNSTMPTPQYPPRNVVLSWPQTAVYQSSAEDHQEQHAESWPHGGAYQYGGDPKKQQQQMQQQQMQQQQMQQQQMQQQQMQQQQMQQQQQRIFQMYGRGPPIYPQAAAAAAAATLKSGPQRMPRGPAQGTESSMPEPHPYFEGSNEDCHPRQPMPRRRVMQVPGPRLMSLYPGQHQAMYEQQQHGGLAPAPSLMMPEEEAEKDKNQHVLSGPTFYGLEQNNHGSAVPAATPNKYDEEDERVEYY